MRQNVDRYKTQTQRKNMLDFSAPSDREPKDRTAALDFSAQMSKIIDDAIVAKREAEPPRTYLGGSRLGHPKAESPSSRGCERALFYEYKKTRNEKPFSGQLYRIFDMGHDAETRVAEYLRLAGFDLATEKEDGKQFGFYIAPDPETGKPRIAGHYDGIIKAGPDFKELVYPALWENKGMNDKKWGQVVDHGVERANSVYYGQMQVYMGFAQLKNSLFTAINRDSGEIYFEVVGFNEAHAQAALDRGYNIITATSAVQMSRISTDYNHFVCKWCPYSGQCQKDEADHVARAQAARHVPTQTPEWLK